MMKINSSTLIHFPGGALSGTATIIAYKQLASHPNKLIIITDATPFHPLDYNWPDQPSDKGTINIHEKIIPIDNCLIGAVHIKTGEFLVDQEIKNLKIKRDDPNWYFVVAHIINADLINTDELIDKNIQLEVDGTYRLALSKSHTACHLAALALNKLTAPFWKKLPEYYDSLGNPDFDKEALTSSRISEENSIEHYRCGKTLRKKGFDSQLFLTENSLTETELAVNNQLSNWCLDKKGIIISIQSEKAFLHEVRKWHCVFPDGKEAVIPCGGTHIKAITSREKIVVNFIKENDQEFSMVSKWVAASN